MKLNKKKKIEKPQEIKTKKSLNFNEKKELETLPKEIEKLEEEQCDLMMKMSSPDYFKQSKNKLALDKDRTTELDVTLEKLYVRWENLEEIK